MNLKLIIGTIVFVIIPVKFIIIKNIKSYFKHKNQLICWNYNLKYYENNYEHLSKRDFQQIQDINNMLDRFSPGTYLFNIYSRNIKKRFIKRCIHLLAEFEKSQE